MPDFLTLNGNGGFSASGDVATQLLKNNFDTHSLRPWVGDDGYAYQTIVKNGVARAVRVNNANTTLRKDEWKLLDDVVIKAARQRLKAVADLRGRGLEMTLANGLGKTVLQWENQSDITDAVVSMDGLREDGNDRPEYELNNLPLPIIHKDFRFSARAVEASRNGGSPLDTTGPDLAARKVAEMAEKLLLGKATGTTYGGGTVYGYTNHPDANTKTITAPTATGWTAKTTLTEVLQMRQQAKDDYHFGPYMLYCSPSWDVYMDGDYSDNKGDNTLRQRIAALPDIEDVRTLDYLESYDLVLVQMTQNVARMVVGMDVTTVQWPSKGGMQLNYKVMAILVPQIRSDISDRCGIVYGSI